MNIENLNYESVKYKVYIWGCGKYGMLQSMLFSEKGSKVLAFIDNDCNKYGWELIPGIPCVGFEQIELEGDEVCVISVSNTDLDSIAVQAKNMGFVNIYVSDFYELDCFANHLDDKTYLEIMWKVRHGYDINWENPILYTEKLQWLKLNDRKKEYIQMVDKYESKKYVAQKIGWQYIIPTLGIWNSVDEIDFDKLPNEFVLKCTHDSGGVVVCKEKKLLDVDKVKEILKRNMQKDFYLALREWPYKYVTHRIIAEKYIEDSKDEELRDYKIFTFNGKAKYMLLTTNRQNVEEELTFDYFDVEGRHLDLVDYWHPNAVEPPHMPNNLKKMVEIAEILAEGIPQIRVDLYEVNGKIYFGELTFFHWGGDIRISPKSWDKEWGDLVVLPTLKGEEE